MKINVVVIGYGEQYPEGVGFYAHPDGGSCALTVETIEVFDDEEAALERGIFLETLREVHHVTFEVEEN